MDESLSYSLIYGSSELINWILWTVVLLKIQNIYTALFISTSLRSSLGFRSTPPFYRTKLQRKRGEGESTTQRHEKIDNCYTCTGDKLADAA